MNNNIFEHFREQKEKLLGFASKAKEYGWIDETREASIREKLESDCLTIGVIGQMKCGKSTFLNAFVFENDILPAATTPMTASLSVITYGEVAKVVAEFYTKDEWIEQETLARQSLDGLSDVEASKIKAARELVEKSAPIRSSIETYLGTTQEASLDRLIDYVGADGKFVSITKSVKIFYPKEYLRGVEIVDTPGFNDPIVSREQRTKEFLKKADVVVMMLYAGRPFDRTDRTILFENVKQCGIGKVLIAINKYDIQAENGDMPEEIQQYVIDQIKEESRKCHDNTLIDILKNTEPILISAEMGLLSELPMSRILANSSYDHSFKRYSSAFDISGQTKLREFSHLDQLADAIKTMVENEKYDILLKKPLNAIFACGTKKKEDLELELNQVEAEIKILNTPDDDLEEKEYNLSKVERRLIKKIDGLASELQNAANDVIKNGKYALEDEMDACCKSMIQKIEGVGRFEKFENILPSLESICDNFDTRTSRRLVERIAVDMKKKILSVTENFYIEAESIICKYLPDLDGNDFVNNIKNNVKVEIEDDSIFKTSVEGVDDESSLLDVVVPLFRGFLAGATFGLSEVLGRGFAHDRVKNDLLSDINKIKANFDAQEYMDFIYKSEDKVIDTIKKQFIDNLITPLRDIISECRNNLSQKEARLEAANQRKNEIISSLNTIKEQISCLRSCS